MPSRRRRFRSKPKPQVKRPPANDEITAPEVRLVGVEGQQLGVVSLVEAKRAAEEASADLVIVAEKTSPPVVRLMDLGKHMYEKRKKDAKQKSKSKAGDIKGIRIGFKMGEHDWQIRLNRADGFLKEGHKVKLEMRLRGREKGRVDMAKRKMSDFITQIPGGAAQEGNISAAPNNISVMVARTRGAAAAATAASDNEASESGASA